MARKTIALIVGAALALAAGCIVGDQLTTITILPDGSADWTRFQSNLRSTEKGAKGTEEVKRMVAEFDARKDADLQRVVRAGGQVLEARWVRREEPCSNLVVARFPTAAALEEFCTVRGEKGEVVAQARFTRCGDLRRFSFLVPVPRDEKPGEVAQPTLLEARQNQANGISETRIAVAAGRIVDSRGFTVAADERSALLEPAKVYELFKAGGEKVEIYLEWEVALD